MTLKLDKQLDKNIFLELEYGLPIIKNPFAVIGNKFGVTEKVIFNKSNSFTKSKLVRRFGGIFELNKLGYCSILCAVRVEKEKIEKISRHLTSMSNITHCYIRDHFINLWFTYSAEQQYFDDNINELKSYFYPSKLICLKALKRYKLSVVFDLGIKTNKVNNVHYAGNIKAPYTLNETDKQLIRELRNIPLISNPYGVLASKFGLSLNFLLKKLQSWQQEGILKRIALIPYHYNLGYKFNIMCVWKVETNRIDQIGKKIAECSEISHCYERETHPEFMYNLYAMVHGNTYETTNEFIGKISSSLSLNNGVLLRSTKEIKKISLKLFQ